MAIVAIAAGVFAFVVCAPAAFPVASMPLLDWGVVLYLGVIQIAIAYIFIHARA